MEKIIKSNLTSITLIIISLVCVYYFYDSVPEMIASQFDFSGNVTSSMSKRNFFLLMPLVNIFVLFSLPFLVKISPKDYQMENSDLYLGRINLSITVLVMGLYVGLWMYHSTLVTLSFYIAISAPISLFMIFFGNYMGKLERNFFAGIRLPWTIASEQNWRATHRVAGKLLVGAGFISFLLSLILQSFTISVVLLLAALVISCFYSFYYYRKNELVI